MKISAVQMIAVKPTPVRAAVIVQFWVTLTSPDGELHETGGEACMVRMPSGLRRPCEDFRVWVSPNFRAWLAFQGFEHTDILADHIESKANGI